MPDENFDVTNDEGLVMVIRNTAIYLLKGILPELQLTDATAIEREAQKLTEILANELNELSEMSMWEYFSNCTDSDCNLRLDGYTMYLLWAASEKFIGEHLTPPKKKAESKAIKKI